MVQGVNARALLMSKLTRIQQRKLLYRLPKGAVYMREALRDFWRLDLQPAKPVAEREIGSESLWFNHSFNINVEWRARDYFSDVLEVNLVSDIINGTTGLPFTRRDWRDWVKKLEEDRTGVAPPPARIIEMGDAMHAAARQVPRAIRHQLALEEEHEPQEGETIGVLIRY